MSDVRSGHLPDFKAAPVTEVALSVSFASLQRLGNVDVIELWRDAFRDRFPLVEEHLPLEPAIETFGGLSVSSRPSFHVQQAPIVARYWFLDPLKQDLIQVQRDRFVRNWRKVDGGGDYPRYSAMRQCFEEDFRLFCDYLSAKSMGAVKPTHCELTYVNTIEAGSAWERHGQVSQVVRLFQQCPQQDFLLEPEDVGATVRYLIPGSKGPIGRLNVQLRPAYLLANEQPILQLNMIARGQPETADAAGVLSFFDVGHEWIVRGFADVTTKEMHRVWERIDEQ